MLHAAAAHSPAKSRKNMALLTMTLPSLLSELMIASGSSGASRDETGSLLAFKAELTGHGSDVLASWNSKTSFCGWEGVACGHGRVVALSLPSYGLTGTLSPAIGNLTSLRTLNLSSNWFKGEIPASIGRLELRVGGNILSGTIPFNIGDRFRSIEILGFTANRFSGVIPPSLSNLSTLTDLRQQFYWICASCSGDIASGNLPSSIVNLSTTLQTLYLGDNRVSGVIPSNIGNLVGLKTLEMTHTSISGVIPESIGRLENLIELGLYNTSLSGLIPLSLGNLTQLTRLYAYYGNLEGPIPASLGKLKNLFILDLSTNRLNGSIPGEVLKLPELSIYLDLSYNSLSGPLPSEVGSLTKVDRLILSGNQLSGSIPDSIEDLSARVGDFGISKILTDNTGMGQLNSVSFTGIRGSIGYVPPEYGEGCAVSTFGDVYSLGILMLEMFTGRSPTDDIFKDSLDLHKFAEASLPNRAMGIADPAIWLHEEAADADAANATMARRRIESCLVSVIGLGVSCSKQQPRERMLMRDAAVEMREIRDGFLMVAGSLNGNLEDGKKPAIITAKKT
ncbi:MDIS1-interacting receptor like kinase 2 [Dichanthelium oligosanthes]|uniref:non-specific serine/threonine protein kinase n=1 Tax=Dichanthelium oligosanthes TaxID=888268 RepID=A0A1E5W203_9POAL|nr:MDIS1-interacting receptor like kinase 2 [Dichanthelium oligosanthes]